MQKSIIDSQTVNCSFFLSAFCLGVGRSFLLRLNLTNPTDMVLIDCKFQLVYRRFLTSPGQLSPYITTVPLKLMHAEVAYLRYALVVRHVIDDESPLYGLDIEVGHVVNLPHQLLLHVSSFFFSLFFTSGVDFILTSVLF